MRHRFPVEQTRIVDLQVAIPHAGAISDPHVPALRYAVAVPLGEFKHLDARIVGQVENLRAGCLPAQRLSQFVTPTTTRHLLKLSRSRPDKSPTPGAPSSSN